jgi:hypothetical protein
MNKAITRAILFPVAMLVTPAAADVLELKDGQVLNGRYVGGNQIALRFETAEGVQAIETSRAVALTFTTPPPAPAAPPLAIPSAQAQPAVIVVPAAPAQPATVPAGTVLLVRMMDGISSHNKAGTRFTTVLEADLIAEGRVVARAGTKVYGEIKSSSQARRAVGRSSIDISLTQIDLGGGLQPISTSNFDSTGKSSGMKTAGGALVGAGVGAAVDGSKGAGKGAAIGAGVSLLKKGDTVTVPPGALLEFRLTQPVRLSTSR